MRILLSLAQVAFMLCAARGNIIALPIDDNLGLQRSQVKEQRNLQQIFSGMKLPPFGDVDPGKHLHLQMEERSLRKHIPSRSRSPCKSFFWKTFSVC
uniref:Somatostatin-2-like n=1 Tax=Myripristis murdjan TaxID=586833 RepID=A0A667X3H2_9TELE